MIRNADLNFSLGGFARRDYAISPTWKAIYMGMESFSNQFVAVAWRKGRRGYGWPLDPLHNWSRLWEYPFVAHQLATLNLLGRQLRTLDIGPAVTFFTPWMMKHGVEVTNIDFDPANSKHFARAFHRLKSTNFFAGSGPRYLTGDARATGLPTASFDTVVCISVLEHIPGWERTIPEIDRLLVSGGHLILTFDVRLDETSNGLSSQELETILRLLREAFEPLTRQENEVPPDRISEDNVPIPIPPQPPETHRLAHLLTKLWPPATLAQRVGRGIRRSLVGQRQSRPERITVYGGVWRKR